MVPVIPMANFNALRSGGSLPVHVAVGATALYDLRFGWDRKGGLEGWQAFQEKNAENLPPPGAAWPFIKELTLLNRFVPDPMNQPLVRVHLVSRMGFGDSQRIIGALRRDFKPDFNKTFLRSSYTDGQPIVPHLMALGIHLYLAGNAREAYRVMKEGMAAVHIQEASGYKIKTDLLTTPLFLSWDADGTIWDDSSEQVFQKGIAEGGLEHGVKVYHEHEDAKIDQPNGPGPLLPAFASFCSLRSVFPKAEFPISPFQHGIITARGFGSQARVHTNLKALGDLGDFIDIYEGMSGNEKGPWIKLHNASLHLDDGAKHNASAVKHGVPAGHVIAGVANEKLMKELEALLNPEQAQQRLFWIDLETTGVDLEKPFPLEIAILITDGFLNTMEEYQRVIYQPPNVLAGMNEWAKKHHKESGLLDEVPGGLPMEQVEKEILELIGRHFPKDEKVVLRGSSVGFDQGFVQRFLPGLARQMHYHIVDVTSWELEFQRLYGMDLRSGKTAHRALADIKDSCKRLAGLLRYVSVP